ncbi:MAG: hypothetical protein Q8L98_07820 [Chlamydiales bacterium]|nr:hypothetical protein [Chlamydiales bacterium]
MTCSTLTLSSSLATVSPSPWQMTVLKAASYLTDPICKTQESYYLYASGQREGLTETFEQAFTLLVIGVLANAALALFTTPLGALLRYIVVLSCPEKHLFIEREGSAKILPADRTLTMLSYNVCFMPGGYAETDGGVTPPSYNNRERVQKNIDRIKQKDWDPDILCLYEVPDICDAAFLSEQLSDYPYIIPMAGPKTVGPSSMMYVASKYPIDRNSITFTPFTKGEELTGRAAHSEKGLLSFDLANCPVSIVSTHLQHSEIPEQATPEDEKSRPKQMERIAQKIKNLHEKGKIVIFTGDLNNQEKELLPTMEALELIRSSVQEPSTNTLRFLHRGQNVAGKPTWGGDAWCTKFMGRTSSKDLVLDYTFVSEEAEIMTEIHQVGFDSEKPPLEQRDALSDHCALLSRITLPLSV